MISQLQKQVVTAVKNSKLVDLSR